jgi:hypothetical protein
MLIFWRPNTAGWLVLGIDWSLAQQGIAIEGIKR